MMQNLVTAATSAAPQITPTPEPMKVGSSTINSNGTLLAKHNEVSKHYMMSWIRRTAGTLLA